MPNAADELEAHEWLFENGPPLALQRRLGLVREKHLNVRRRAAGMIVVGWVPLLLLAVVSDVLFQTHDAPSLLHDAGAYARYLFAAPLLILAESDCGQRLSAIVGNFVHAGIIRDHQRARFEALVNSTRDLINSRIAEAAVIALAVLAVAAAAATFPPAKLPDWYKDGEAPLAFSLAGWWHVFVSLPLLIILMLGWAWRFVLWARLLWQITNLDLHLIASHPDRSAGLCFVGQSLRAFAPVALAITVIAAGRSANVVLDGGALPTPNIKFNAGLIVALLVLFTAPLLVFSRNLFNVWHDATFQYGALATRVGALFEEKWLRGAPTDSDTILEKPDFSATTDLYGVVANVNALRFVPVDLNSAVALVGFILLPFVPVVLLAVPAATIWEDVKSLLF